MWWKRGGNETVNHEVFIRYFAGSRWLRLKMQKVFILSTFHWVVFCCGIVLTAHNHDNHCDCQTRNCRRSNHSQRKPKSGIPTSGTFISIAKESNRVESIGDTSAIAEAPRRITSNAHLGLSAKHVDYQNRLSVTQLWISETVTCGARSSSFYSSFGLSSPQRSYAEMISQRVANGLLCFPTALDISLPTTKNSKPTYHAGTCLLLHLWSGMFEARIPIVCVTEDTSQDDISVSPLNLVPLAISEMAFTFSESFNLLFGHPYNTGGVWAKLLVSVVTFQCKRVEDLSC